MHAHTDLHAHTHTHTHTYSCAVQGLFVYKCNDIWNLKNYFFLEDIQVMYNHWKYNPNYPLDWN